MSLRSWFGGDVAEAIRPVQPTAVSEAVQLLGLDRSTLGLIARDCPLLRPLLKEGQGCTARIEAITRGASGTLNVTIGMELGGQPIGARAFRGN